MAIPELCGLTIAQAGDRLRAGDITALELAEAYLARIESLDPRINAYITVTAERALEDARRATDEMQAGKSRGSLHGIPIGLKDLYETAGIVTTGGGKFHANHVPHADCTAAARLREAGTVLLGKLNTHEYAYGVTTNNPHSSTFSCHTKPRVTHRFGFVFQDLEGVFKLSGTVSEKFISRHVARSHSSLHSFPPLKDNYLMFLIVSFDLE